MKRENEIRKELLMQLYACRPIARTAERMHHDARRAGYDYARSEIESELEFLADELLLIRVEAPGTTSRMYRIHANGVRHYEQTFS